MADNRSLDERGELIDSLVARGADRVHLESLTPEQFRRFREIAAQIAKGELRRVALSDGTGVLVDCDDPTPTRRFEPPWRTTHDDFYRSAVRRPHRADRS